MLSCGKIVGRLAKVTRHTQAGHLHQPLKYIGAANVNSIRYNSNTKNERLSKPLGATVKPEECVPDLKSKNIPPCESGSASCPPSYYENCQKRHNGQAGGSNEGGEKDNKSQLPPYWKQTLAALIITGVSIYAIYSNWFASDKSQKSEKIISKEKDDAKKHKRSKGKVRVPAESSLMPQEIQYLLIGGGTAAFSAFRSIKSQDPKAKVLVITEEEAYPYMRPPLSKELWFNEDRNISRQLQFMQWNGVQRSIFYEPQEFYTNVNNLAQSDKGGVSIATGWKVKEIDVANKTVFLDDDYAIKYDKCLIATGASAKNLPIFESVEGEVKEKITTFRTERDFLELEEKLQDPNCKNVVVIGGGFLGSELACSLARNYSNKNKKIIQVFKEKFIMAQILPEYLSEWATQKAQMEGVNTIPSTEVKDFSYKNGRLSLVLSDGRLVDADQIIVAVGVKPNTELAKSSHLEVDPQNGGFIVNAELEARSNLWVAGDAACFYDVRFGRRRVEHHDHAVISGRLAGDNMTGAGLPYLHQSMFWSDLGPEIAYEAIGIIDSSLPTVGIFAKPENESIPLKAVNSLNTEETPVDKQEAESTSQITDKNNNTNTEKQNEQNVKSPEKPTNYDFRKGVVFYLRDDVVVGILLWNIFNRITVARQVLTRGTKYDDLNEVAKLFTIHDDQ